MSITEEVESIREKQGIAFDIRQADGSYQPFPAFSDWAKCEFDSARWDRYVALNQETQKASEDEDLLARARDEIKRAAAVETGAIEGLYDSHRGITFTAGVSIAVWQAALDKMEEQERKLIQSQLEAYDYVLDFATEKQPIVQAWIRELHKVICSAQKTFCVLTAVSWQNQELRLGEYKTQPNHVRKTSTGEIHSYAPVDRTEEEMQRLCQELNSDEFRRAHPVLQSSYAHYAFVCIHPFSDGNGRMARALASVFTYRSNSIPLLITTEHKGSYFFALEAADRGNYQPFVNFILESILDAFRVVSDSIRTAKVRSRPETISDFLRLYETKGGYTHSQVDEAGMTLFQMLYDSLDKARHELDEEFKGSLQFALQRDQQEYTPVRGASRVPVKHGYQRILLQLNSASPADAQVVYSISLEVPKDCDRDDEIILFNQVANEIYEAKISEILPIVRETLRMRIQIWADDIIRRALVKLKELAEGSLRKKGY